MPGGNPNADYVHELFARDIQGDIAQRAHAHDPRQGRNERVDAGNEFRQQDQRG